MQLKTSNSNAKQSQSERVSNTCTQKLKHELRNFTVTFMRRFSTLNAEQFEIKLLPTFLSPRIYDFTLFYYFL